MALSERARDRRNVEVGRAGLRRVRSDAAYKTRLSPHARARTLGISARVAGRLVVPTTTPVQRMDSSEKRSEVEFEISHLRRKKIEELSDAERSALTDARTGAVIPPERAVFALHADRHHTEYGISAAVWDGDAVRAEIRARTFFRKPPADPSRPYGDLFEPPAPEMRLMGWETGGNAFHYLDEQGYEIPHGELVETARRAIAKR